MKALLIVIFFTLNLYAGPKIETLVLPEDSNTFIYFLQKKLSQKHQTFSIVSPMFNLPQLVNTIRHNRRSRFEIYINQTSNYPNSIKKLALYRQVAIYVCKDIKGTFISLPKKQINVPVALSSHTLTTQHAKLKIVSQSAELGTFPQACIAY